MPTIGVYVPMPIARTIAQNFQIDAHDPDMIEVVRGICHEALETEAGIQHQPQPFSPNCEWGRLHQMGRRCRHCGGR